MFLPDGVTLERASRGPLPGTARRPAAEAVDKTPVVAALVLAGDHRALLYKFSNADRPGICWIQPTPSLEIVRRPDCRRMAGDFAGIAAHPVAVGPGI
jgi:hypothetical protein